jgi:4-amino-4-deoxy-L-arabinose transferase-like glycosyltransferase
VTAQESVGLGLGERPAVAARTWPTDRVAVAGLVTLALLLRVPDVGRAYWIDEGITVGIASHPVSQIPSLLRQDGSPPLFYLLLHFWIRLFGTSEAATHTLPLVISLIAIPVAYWAGRELFDRRAGLAAAALYATNPFLGWYSTETRMYPLVVLLATLAVTFAVRAVRNRRWTDGAAAVLSYAALLYTHNWGVYLFAVSALLIGAMALARGDRRVAVGVLVASAAVVVLWLPWLPSVLDQASNTAAPWAVRPPALEFVTDGAAALGGTLGLISVPFLVLGCWWTRRNRPAADEQLARFLAAIGVLTAVLGWVAAQIEPSWAQRYLAIVVPPVLLALAGALACSRTGRRVLVVNCAVLGAWGAIGSMLPNANAQYAKSNVKAIALAVRPYLAPGDVVVVTQTEQMAVLAHYLPKGLIYVNPTGAVTDPYVVDWRHLLHRLQAAQACQAVEPAIAALPVGGAVLELDPATQNGVAGTPWEKAISLQQTADDRLLSANPALEPVSSFDQALHPRPLSAVVAELYRKVPGSDPCQ